MKGRSCPCVAPVELYISAVSVVALAAGFAYPAGSAAVSAVAPAAGFVCPAGSGAALLTVRRAV